MLLSLKAKVQDFLSFPLSGDSEQDYQSIIARMCSVSAELRRLEQLSCNKSDVISVLEPLRQLASTSRFFHHMQAWPRGYPGDFEMIESIIQAENKAAPGTKAFYIEQYGLASSSAQQHRNKIKYQSQSMMDVIFLRKKSRVLSIACGSCPDIRAIAPYIQGRKVEFVLLDSDADALKFSQEQLQPFSLKCEAIHANILRGIVDLKKQGQFDLIVIGGLFDYLKDEMIVKILTSLKSYNLNTSGLIFFTNIGECSPDRTWIEYVCSWFLIHRSEARLKSLTEFAGFLPANVVIKKESANLTYLVECFV